MAASHFAAQRRFARYALDVRAKLSAGEQEITARTLDVSEGGVGVISPVEIKEGTLFTIELVFPTVQGVFRAEVQQQGRNGFRYGFQFVGIDESSLGLFRRFQRRWGIFADDSYANRG